MFRLIRQDMTLLSYSQFFSYSSRCHECRISLCLSPLSVSLLVAIQQQYWTPLCNNSNKLLVIIINSDQQSRQTGHKQHILVMGPLLQSPIFSFEPNLCKSVPVPFYYLQIPLQGPDIPTLTSYVVPDGSWWQSSCVHEPCLHVCLLNPDVKC